MLYVQMNFVNIDIYALGTYVFCVLMNLWVYALG